MNRLLNRIHAVARGNLVRPILRIVSGVLEAHRAEFGPGAVRGEIMTMLLGAAVFALDLVAISALMGGGNG